MPVYTNSNPLKVVKPGSSSEQVKRIQEANSKLIAVENLIFSPKFQPYIIYKSADKGILSLYILAGDAKDGEAITKALASGNEAEVERAAAEHGIIAVLLWRPAQGSMPVIRALLSGTSSMIRIQQSLDRAARYLPFLNTATVKSEDALTKIPVPTVSGAIRPAPGTRPLTKSAPPSSGSRIGAAPARVPLRAATKTAPPTRPVTTSRPATASKTTSSSEKIRPLVSAHSTPASAKKTSPPVRAPPSSSRSSEDPVALRKKMGRVQRVVPTKQALTGKKAPASKTTAAPVKVCFEYSSYHRNYELAVFRNQQHRLLPLLLRQLQRLLRSNLTTRSSFCRIASWKVLRNHSKSSSFHQLRRLHVLRVRSPTQRYST